jgi:hypothetical protein
MDTKQSAGTVHPITQPEAGVGADWMVTESRAILAEQTFVQEVESPGSYHRRGIVLPAAERLHDALVVQGLVDKQSNPAREVAANDGGNPGPQDETVQAHDGAKDNPATAHGGVAVVVADQPRLQVAGNHRLPCET